MEDEDARFVLELEGVRLGLPLGDSMPEVLDELPIALAVTLAGIGIGRGSKCTANKTSALSPTRSIESIDSPARRRAS